MTTTRPQQPESYVETTHLVLPSDANALGSIFGGTLMSWIDLTAAICAKRYSRQVCVTAAIDEMQFMHPIKVGDIVTLKAAINYTGKSSMEVGVYVEREDPLSGAKVHTNTAYMIFVALDKHGRPTSVPTWTPHSDEEKRRHQEALERLQHRKRWER